MHHENIIIDYDDGPCNLCPSKEIFEIFGVDLKEPAMYFLIMPHETKKNSETTEMCGFRRHKKVEQDVTCFTGLTIFYKHEKSSHEEFNFYVDRSSDPAGECIFTLQIIKCI